MIKFKLRMYMAERLIKITQVAEETGLSRTTLTQIYYGRGKGVAYDTLIKLCKYFDCSISDIIEYEETAV